MCAPFFLAWLKPANSSQSRAGSVHSMPLVPHQCCGPPVFTVAFARGTGFDVAADETALLETSASDAATIAAEIPIPSARLI